MSTPLVAGCAALTRQHLRENIGIKNPSAALLKASLIHSAEYLDYPHSHHTSSKRADNEQGWGRINLKRIVSPEAPTQIIFIDESRGLKKDGDLLEYKIEVKDSSVMLCATLVYTDYPDETRQGSLVNNINLFLYEPDYKSDERYYIGNDFENKKCPPDSLNNVEGIVVENPPVGIWTVKVAAAIIRQPDQDFALVISGGGLTLK